MRIIKEGDINKLLKVKQFRCLKCGCIFEANNKEYKWYDGGQCYDSGFECNCPTCGNWAYEYSSGEH